MVPQAYNLNSWEAEMVGLPWIQGQPELYSESEASIGYRVRPRLKKKKSNSVIVSNKYALESCHLCKLLEVNQVYKQQQRGQKHKNGREWSSIACAKNKL